MNEITITAELAQAIVSYLEKKPYIEVFQLIGAVVEASRKEVKTPELTN